MVVVVPQPTETPTLVPMQIPTPEEPTPTPLPTLVPLSTYTPLPTGTPRPTFTPQPTYTQFPTPTVKPTATRVLRRILVTTTPITRYIPIPIPTATPAAFNPENYLCYISLLDAYVSDIMFFEPPFELRPESERVYADKFDQASAQYIPWELRFNFPAPKTVGNS